MDIFETASRKKYRFPSSVGDLTAEQLWDLPLTSTGNRPNLDTIARAVNAELKGVTEESFVALKPDPRKADFETMLEVVKRVIAAKMEERANAEAVAIRAEKRRKLAEALASKQDQALANLSEEEILKQLAELEAA